MAAFARRQAIRGNESIVTTAPQPITSPVRLARTAGLYYLIVGIFGGFAEVVRVNVYVPNHAAMTVRNIVDHAALVKFSVVADLVQATFALFLVLALFRLLAHVHQGLARAMVVFVVVQVAVTCLNLVHQWAALQVATDPAYRSGFGGRGSSSLVLLLMDMHHIGYVIAQIFFGLWLFPLGLLAYRSAMFPRPLGVILMVATVAYLLDTVLQLTAPSVSDVVSPIAVVPLVTIAELWMVFYLLIKGVRTPGPTGSRPPDGGTSAPSEHAIGPVARP